MRYDVLLCDADNTLFDFTKAEENAFAIACEGMGFSATPELLHIYSEINEGLWKLLEQGKIEQSVLRVRRFEDFLKAVGKTAMHRKCATHLLTRWDSRACFWMARCRRSSDGANRFRSSS